MSAEIVELEHYRNYPSEPHFYNSDHRARVVEFHPKLARCGICGSPHHRASKCKLRPASDSKPSTGA